MSKPEIQAHDLRHEAHNIGDTFELDPDTQSAGVHYRWVKETPTRVARHKMLGYRMVDKDEGVALQIEGDDAADGRIRNGDCILMACDKERVKRRRQGYEDLAAFRTKRSGDDVAGNAKKKGVRSFRKSPGEDPEEEDDES